MNCPRCTKDTLDEHERDGVTIDRCRTCRGIWLDRGELEKLLAVARQDAEDADARRGARGDDDDDHDDTDDRQRGARRGARRTDDHEHDRDDRPRRWWDIFD